MDKGNILIIKRTSYPTEKQIANVVKKGYQTKIFQMDRLITGPFKYEMALVDLIGNNNYDLIYMEGFCAYYGDSKALLKQVSLKREPLLIADPLLCSIDRSLSTLGVDFGYTGIRNIVNIIDHFFTKPIQHFDGLVFNCEKYFKKNGLYYNKTS